MEAMQSLSVLTCFIGMIVLMMAIMMAGAIRIVPEYRRLLVYRLGREIGEKGPGIVLLIPFVDRGVLISVREDALKAQTLFKKDKDCIKKIKH